MLISGWKDGYWVGDTQGSSGFRVAGCVDIKFSETYTKMSGGGGIFGGGKIPV